MKPTKFHLDGEQIGLRSSGELLQSTQDCQSERWKKLQGTFEHKNVKFQEFSRAVRQQKW